MLWTVKDSDGLAEIRQICDIGLKHHLHSSGGLYEWLWESDCVQAISVYGTSWFMQNYAGLALLRKTRDLRRYPKSGYNLAVYVKPEHRRQKIGTQLVHAVIQGSFLPDGLYVDAGGECQKGFYDVALGGGYNREWLRKRS